MKTAPRRRPKALYLVGASGHAKVLADIARSMGEFSVRGFFDDAPRMAGQEVAGIPVLGPIRLLRRVPPRSWVVIAIGTNATRAAFAAEALAAGARLATLVHSSAVIAPGVLCGEGSVVMAGAVVNPGTTIGRNVIINTAATIDHDCTLGDDAHVSPGAHLAGGVQVGAGTHIGIGAVLIQNIRVGAGSVVGAGAVVIRDVPAGVVVVGNPARLLRRAAKPRNKPKEA